MTNPHHNTDALSTPGYVQTSPASLRRPSRAAYTAGLLGLLLTLSLLAPACGAPTSEEEDQDEPTTTVSTVPADPEDLEAARRTATAFLTSLFEGNTDDAFPLLSPFVREEQELDEQEFAGRFPTEDIEIQTELTVHATGITDPFAAVFHTVDGILMPGKEDETRVQSTITLLHDSQDGWRVLAFGTRDHDLGEISDILIDKIGEGSYKIQFQHVDPQTGPGRGVIRLSAPNVPVD